MLGYHAKTPLDVTISEGIKQDIKWFQIMVSNPKAMQGPNNLVFEKLREKFKGVEIIVHGPYWVSLCNDPGSPVVSATVDYYSKLSKGMDRCGYKYIVTHIGSRKCDKQQAVRYLRDFCLRWLWLTKGHNTVLCLENDAGSKNDKKMGHLDALRAVVKDINSPRIRICIDTEHAYANGHEIEDLYQYLDYADVVHLNSVPSYVEKGRHLDRHSTTLIEDCKYNPIRLIEFYKNAKVRGIPSILERDGFNTAYKDILYLRERISGDFI